MRQRTSVTSEYTANQPRSRKSAGPGQGADHGECHDLSTARSAHRAPDPRVLARPAPPEVRVAGIPMVIRPHEPVRVPSFCAAQSEKQPKRIRRIVYVVDA